MRGPGFAQHTGFARSLSGPTPAITPVGSPYTTYSGNGTPNWSQTVVNAHVGDLLVVTVTTVNSNTLSGVTLGGVTTWNIDAHVVTGAITSWMFWGIITSTGTQFVTITWNQNTSGVMTTQEFGKNTGTFSNDGAAATATSDALTLDLPTLVPSANNELYVGSYYTQNGTPSISSGYTLLGPSGGGLLYDDNVSGAQSPVITTTSSGNNIAVCQLFAI